MTREEHLEWCKLRAMEYVNANNLDQAIASIMSDLSKHNETVNHIGIQLGMMLLISGNLSTRKQVEEFILGFN